MPRFEEPSTRSPDELNEYDRREFRRLILVTRPGEHSGSKREAWVITLKTGREVVLVIPVETARELAKMDGYIGRVRPARDDDHIQVTPTSTRGGPNATSTQ